MKGIQIRAARSLLNWSQQELANRSDLGLSTIQRIERAENLVGLASTAAKIRQTLEDAGAVFIEAGPDGGPGVRLKT
jgi:transcriptional regulator with XRE-family HTH domain